MFRDYHLDTISIDDVLHTLRECERNERYEGMFEHMLTFASELTGMSADALSEAMYENRKIEFDKLVFHDYDDTGMPLQFFFGYNLPKEQLKDQVFAWGFRGDLCESVELCLDLYTPDICPLEAVLTFTDGEQRWVDVLEKTDSLDDFMQVIKNTDTPRAKEALQLFEELCVEQGKGKPALDEQISSAAARASDLQSLSDEPAKPHDPTR